MGLTSSPMCTISSADACIKHLETWYHLQKIVEYPILSVLPDQLINVQYVPDPTRKKGRTHV